MKALKIIRCSDSLMWYSSHVGSIFPLVREYEYEYLSREPAGYANIILKCDAVVVDIGSLEASSG